MTTINQAGSLNVSALAVPDLYLQLQPPSTVQLNGVPTNLIAIVGSATWGPVNQPTVFGGQPQLAATFGNPAARAFDLGSQVLTASAQGANNFVGVRVTDGTDTAASLPLAAGTGSTFAVQLAAIYTGSTGNTLSAVLTPGSKPSSWNLIVGILGSIPEVYTNIDASVSPAAFWSNLVAAVNNGAGQVRGPSQLVLASIGTATATAPSAMAATPFTGGTDGAAGVTAQTLVGSNSTPGTGMYALVGSDASIGVLADATDSTTWSTITQFGMAEGIYMIVSGPSGENIASAQGRKIAAGVDSYALKVMLGDFLTFYDPVNQISRAMSPAGFEAGRLAMLSPNQSSLNKPIYGIAGSQRSGSVAAGSVTSYSGAELGSLFSYGLDVICYPAPGGAFWTCRGGFNASSNAGINGDEYTRMSNYILTTVGTGMGIYVGEDIVPELLQDIRSTLLDFLGNMLLAKMLSIGLDGSLPYSVVCDLTNNTMASLATNYVRADIFVRYNGINRKFLVNLQGGEGVSITVASSEGSTPSTAAVPSS